MPAESITAPVAGAQTIPRGDLFGDAAALLVRAAAPERRHLAWGVAWLVLAAGLEALGPLIGKFLIDNYLLPRNARIPEIAGLLFGALVAGTLASWLRYRQLVRLAGLAMRSVQRIREGVYGHVLRLPMSFFDRAIIGQLVSRVTNDTEAVKTLYVQVLFVMLDSLIVLCGVVAVMLWLDWRLMLIVATLAPAVALIVTMYQRFSGAGGDDARASCAATSMPRWPNPSTAWPCFRRAMRQRASPSASPPSTRRTTSRGRASCAPTPGCCARCWTCSTWRCWP